MDPAISYHFGSHPPPPQATLLASYPPLHPYQHSMTPYSTLPNECMYITPRVWEYKVIGKGISADTEMFTGWKTMKLCFSTTKGAGLA
jgi:hypothetical protein